MDYKKIYNSIIDRSKTRSIDKGVYFEKHHIVPKCMGGLNNKDNIAKLLAAEHYICHLLLVKIYPGNSKLVHAATMMCVENHYTKGKRNNKQYAWLRVLHSSVLKDKPNAAEHIAKCSAALQGRVFTDEWKKRLSDAKIGKSRKPHTKETKNIMSQNRLNNIEMIECTHCNRLIDSRNFVRWHGNKCKLKGESNV
jgi:hypothetical protein